MRTTRLALAGALSLALVGLPVAAATAAPVATAAPAVMATSPTQLGTSSDTAAGSCWEIKQQNSAATDGDYWLLTPAMAEPQQFYCDMTTDGGGWVLVGKGRDGWSMNALGHGVASQLLSPDTNPMGQTTVEYSAPTVDALLNNGRVDALSDGVRLRRATNSAGTSWQEARLKFSMFGHWAWAFGALYPLSSWSFGTTNGTGGVSQNFGADNTYNRVMMVPQQSNTFHQGFAFGSSSRGTSAASSYLWSATDNGAYAIPYTQVYLRPKVTSGDSGFTQIPDSGTKAYSQQAHPQSNAIASPWGVSGIAGNVGTEGDVEVQAFTQSGDNMYVGGNFKYVQQDGNGTGQVTQPFLAAFNVNSGQWVSSFRPVLNEQVHALATLPNGDVVAGGEFSSANGQTASAIVALNPTTGATDPSWHVSMENRKTGGMLRINALDVSQNYLYIGGAFTHLSGGTRSTAVFSGNLARVSVTDGTPVTTWNPTLNGTVNDVNGTDSSDSFNRVYAAGFFTQSQGQATKSAASFEKAAGAPLSTPLWAPTWSNSNNYQRAIDAVGSEVWVGGSEHDLFQFDSSTFSRLMGDIMLDKGDIQVISDGGGLMYAGCHCNYYDYHNAYTWPTLSAGWTRADSMTWFGAFNPDGSRVSGFEPSMSSRLGSGIWAIQVDSLGNVWAGGDIQTAATASSEGRWAGAFARFAPNDSTAPPTPANARVVSQTSTTVTLGWNAVDDASGVHYQILRDDRPIATATGTTVTVPKGGSGRYFVRAADGAGNYSASSPVVVAGSGLIQPASSFTWTSSHAQVSVDGSGSTSPNGTVSGYSWDFGDGSGAVGAQTTHTYTAAGSYIVTLTVTDSAGATGTSTQTVTVSSPSVNAAPADAYGNQVFQDDPWAYYRLGESSGATTAHDSGPNGRDATYVNSGNLTFGGNPAVTNTTDTSVTSNGTGGFAASPSTGTPPTTFSLEIWFKTTSTRGGRLIGYGNSNTGTSSQYDRHLYLQNTGQLVFGAYTGQTVEVVSPASTPYNNGAWHMAVATMSPTDGMKLYVDGNLVGSDPNGTAENYVGYWKVGGDNLWDGASSTVPTASLDEAAIFSKVLTPQQIGAEYTAGTTVVAQNQPPTAVFTSSSSGATASLDASGSSDPNGSITSYKWDFGDGSATANGQLISHSYANPGTYQVTLTVTDNSGLTNSVTHPVTVSSAPVTTTPIVDSSTWAWRYDAGAPASNWSSPTFDSSGWASGGGPLGFGDASVVTNIDHFATTTDRPRAAYFTRSFTVPDASKVTTLTLNTVADDGVVIYVNGTEVNRTNMPAGAITYLTYASSAVRTAKATQVQVTVPTSLLVNGTNTISAETHLNYRATPDLTFRLKATLTTAQ